MRICFVCNEYPLPTTRYYGGIGIFTKSLARGLYERGHSIFVLGYDIAVNQTNWVDDNGIKVLRIADPYARWPVPKIGFFPIAPQEILKRWYLSQKIAKFVRENAIQVVESYDWTGPLWFAPHHPFVVRIHGSNTALAFYEDRKQSSLLRLFEQRNMQMADQLVAVSKHIGETTLNTFNLKGRSIKIIHNMIETNRFSPLDLPRDPLQVLFVGKTHRRKGIYELLQAWQLVMATIPDAHLALIGVEQDQRINEIMRTWTQEQLSSIWFVGRVSQHELTRWYSESSVAVFPSHAEAFGLTCAEAMSCETPVIMTKLASGPELVADHQTGLLVDPADPSQIASCIIELLQNPSMAQLLGKRAREKVLQSFSADLILEENIAFYQSLVT